MKKALWLLPFCLPLSAAVITFDDLPARTAGQIPTGYSNLNWSSGFTFFDPINYFGSVPNGYSAAIVTSPNIAYNSNAGVGTSISFSSTTPFSFNAVFLTAAWYDNLQVTVTRTPSREHSAWPYPHRYAERDCTYALQFPLDGYRSRYVYSVWRNSARWI